MEKEEHILDEVDKTLKALDDLPRLQSNPFLFTRIRAVLASEQGPGSKSVVRVFKLKPFALALLVVLNIISAMYMLRTERSDYARTRLISSLSEEYNPTQNEFVTGD